MSNTPKTHIVCTGAVYIDTILTVPHFPIEDEKTRASKLVRRRGGNTANTLEVLGQLLHTPAYSESAHLRLLAVLPAKSSSATRYISDSLPYVEVDDACMRDGFEEAASCYVILNEQNMSRTIVSVSELPDMTAAEFMGAVERMSLVEVGGKLWFHFEGRVPEIILECVKWLRERWGKDVCISVECEKPERVGMVEVAKYADVVFYSRLWAEKAGCESAAKFLEGALRYEDYVGNGKIICCTWGSSGATAIRKTTSPINARGYERAQAHAWHPNDANAQPVDTIGAGDTFIAGIVYGLVQYPESSLQRKLEYANELAGRKVFQQGFEGLGLKLKVGVE